MTNDIEHIKELAALHALGALDGEDTLAFARLLAQDADAQRETAALAGVTEALARSLSPVPPSPGLKERILRQAAAARGAAAMTAQLKKMVPTPQAGFVFLKATTGPGWLPSRAPGASLKLLAFDDACDYAIVLGRLEAGAKYPSHLHLHPEDLFMISGDLHIGDEVIRAGDFHHAEAGSTHGVNWSETGCVLVAVLAKTDLLAQLGRS